MECPYCGNEMIKGYLITDGNYMAFRQQRYDSARVAKADETAVQLAKNVFGAAVCSGVYRCRHCRKVILDEE